MARPRLFIVDDDERLIEVVGRVASFAGWEIVGHATSVAQAMSAVPELLRAEELDAGDLLLLDVQLPDGTGIDIARAVAGHPNPPVRVLMSTMDEDDLPDDAKTCGALRFVSKSDITVELFEGLAEAPPPRS